jgi:hypothetical protein
MVVGVLMGCAEGRGEQISVGAHSEELSAGKVTSAATPAAVLLPSLVKVMFSRLPAPTKRGKGFEPASEYVCTASWTVRKSCPSVAENMVTNRVKFRAMHCPAGATTVHVHRWLGR